MAQTTGGTGDLLSAYQALTAPGAGVILAQTILNRVGQQWDTEAIIINTGATNGTMALDAINVGLYADGIFQRLVPLDPFSSSTTRPISFNAVRTRVTANSEISLRTLAAATAGVVYFAILASSPTFAVSQSSV